MELEPAVGAPARFKSRRTSSATGLNCIAFDVTRWRKKAGIITMGNCWWLGVALHVAVSYRLIRAMHVAEQQRFVLLDDSDSMPAFVFSPEEVSLSPPVAIFCAPDISACSR